MTCRESYIILKIKIGSLKNKQIWYRFFQNKTVCSRKDRCSYKHKSKKYRQIEKLLWQIRFVLKQAGRWRCRKDRNGRDRLSTYES